HSCTAHAVIGLVEFLIEQECNEAQNLSRLFLSKTTRQLLMWSGDTGAFVRKTMKAVQLFGVPPEQYWPYDIRHFDEDPGAFLYSYASHYKSLLYARLDGYGKSGEETCKVVKRALADCFPVAF